MRFAKKAYADKAWEAQVACSFLHGPWVLWEAWVVPTWSPTSDLRGPIIRSQPRVVCVPSGSNHVACPWRTSHAPYFVYQLYTLPQLYMHLVLVYSHGWASDGWAPRLWRHRIGDPESRHSFWALDQVGHSGYSVKMMHVLWWCKKFLYRFYSSHKSPHQYRHPSPAGGDGRHWIALHPLQCSPSSRRRSLHPFGWRSVSVRSQTRPVRSREWSSMDPALSGVRGPCWPGGPTWTFGAQGTRVQPCRCARAVHPSETEEKQFRLERNLTTALAAWSRMERERERWVCNMHFNGGTPWSIGCWSISLLPRRTGGLPSLIYNSMQ